MLKGLKDFIELWMTWTPDTVRIGVPFFVQPSHLPVLQVVIQVNRELNTLSLADFEPAAQCGFQVLRGKLANIERAGGSTSEHLVKEFLTQLLPILDQYKGAGAGITPRSFPYISDPQLRSIIERDYGELTLKLFPGGAWKSTVVMAGSILEAILCDRLSDQKWNGKALASTKVPKDKGGKSKAFDEWTLEHMIDAAAAADVGLLNADAANTVHQVLRRYRNFVHPKVEVRAAHACTEAEAMLARGALDSVCNYIEKNP